jgi:hypothetical protein
VVAKDAAPGWDEAGSSAIGARPNEGVGRGWRCGIVRTPTFPALAGAPEGSGWKQPELFHVT